MGQKISKSAGKKDLVIVKKENNFRIFFLLFSMKIEMFFYGKLPKEFRKIGSRSSYNVFYLSFFEFSGRLCRGRKFFSKI